MEAITIPTIGELFLAIVTIICGIGQALPELVIVEGIIKQPIGIIPHMPSSIQALASMLGLIVGQTSLVFRGSGKERQQAKKSSSSLSYIKAQT
ncbi:hypothetical protein ABID29_001088 [Streptococcus rupicaprae]|uniref:Uncharacterized protein n=1 Tax=Streptococcus rupicaprae TaxID=759619 RepID=A0ABV2FHR8_9STRE